MFCVVGEYILPPYAYAYAYAYTSAAVCVCVYVYGRRLRLRIRSPNAFTYAYAYAVGVYGRLVSWRRKKEKRRGKLGRRKSRYIYARGLGAV